MRYIVLIIIFGSSVSGARGQSNPEWQFIGKYSCNSTFMHSYVLTLNFNSEFEITEQTCMDSMKITGKWTLIGNEIRLLPMEGIKSKIALDAFEEWKLSQELLPTYTIKVESSKALMLGGRSYFRIPDKL